MSLNLFFFFFGVFSSEVSVPVVYACMCVCGCTFWGQKRRLTILFPHSFLYSFEVEFFFFFFNRIWSLLLEFVPSLPPSLPCFLSPSLFPSFLLPPLPGECNHGVYVCETILPIELLLYNLTSVWGWGKTKLERIIVCSVLSSRSKNRSQIFRMKI